MFFIANISKIIPSRTTNSSIVEKLAYDLSIPTPNCIFKKKKSHSLYYQESLQNKISNKFKTV